MDLVNQFSSDAQSCLTLQPQGLQDARLPCLSPTSGACSNSCPLNQWCHPTISSFVVPFSSCLQSFPASGSFLMSQLFASGGQTIRASASASVLPMNIQDWFPLGWTGWIFVAVQGTLKSLRNLGSIPGLEIKAVNPKENQPWLSLEGLILNLKLQYFSHLLRRDDLLEKTLMLGKIESKRRRGQ